ncbi:KH domain-containing protein [Acetobacterium fimetarium]|uniref:RNA-binding protein KhpB n=1 Tax=Acetobacterium fimetarium TaxID=52691 RepID=A0ABR6WX96_9FIRM|nr:RNA-binding cell elongation regulator Jag/EloR [Acetobacterium fimetarium]MBC3804871.1 KH domain-containing protein [Acetobacterium fimetarium]
MNKSVTGTGKTVEDAINDGLQQLGVTMDQVETNVLQVPDSGLMKLFGKKEAIVEVKLINDPQQRAFDFLNEVFNAMKVSCNIQMRLEDSILFINLEGKDMGVLIGRRGQTLDSLQYLVSLVINRKKEDYVRVVLDTENYRAKREKTLEDLGEKMANKAVYYQKKMILEPMNPSERRVIHAKLQNNDKVFTFSEGEEPYRRVVIQLKDKN